MKSYIVKIFIALFLLGLSPVSNLSYLDAKGKTTKRAPDSTPKTVRVKSYTKKNGTRVNSYSRRPPKKQAKY